MKFNDLYNLFIEKVDLKGTKPANYNPKTLKKGANVEKEHTDSEKQAKKIAMQHTAEFPKLDKKKKIDTDYYKELDKIEATLKNKQKNTFEEIVDEIQENSMASAGGVFGDSPDIGSHGGQVGNSDWYAPGDARNIFGGNTKKSKKNKHCKKCKSPMIMPLTRRTITK
jgi:hypothetical protein